MRISVNLPSFVDARLTPIDLHNYLPVYILYYHCNEWQKLKYNYFSDYRISKGY
jgi:hypothetical protein